MCKKTLLRLFLIAMILSLAFAAPMMAGATDKDYWVNTTPFQFPLTNMYSDITAESDFYSYTVDSSLGTLKLDGEISEVSGTPPFMSEYVVPGTLHPPGIIYAWVMNDDENLYVAFDVTPDNTMDGQDDYVKVYINTDTGVQVYKVTLVDKTWGRTGFMDTERADYRHKVYELAIPLSEAGSGVGAGSMISLAFSAYGTMSASTVILINDGSVSEGGLTEFTVILSSPTTDSVTVAYETTPVTALEGIDYYFEEGSVTFLPGERTKTIYVGTIEDEIYELDENYTVELFNSSGPDIWDNQGEGTILDDDGPPTVSLSISADTLAENGGASIVTATLTGEVSEQVTVQLGFTGTATGGGTDYTSDFASILIPAGNLSGTATITAVDDSIVEGDETVVVDITSVTYATELVEQTVTATILDDDTSISVSEMLLDAKDYVAANKQYFGKVASSVIKKIDSIIIKWDKGDTVKAVDQVESLISSIAAQSGKNIQPEQAGILIQMLEEILAAMKQTLN